MPKICIYVGFWHFLYPRVLFVYKIIAVKAIMEKLVKNGKKKVYEEM